MAASPGAHPVGVACNNVPPARPVPVISLQVARELAGRDRPHLVTLDILGHKRPPQ